MCESAELALQRHFGYDHFRPGQTDAIRSILSGRDTLVVMPTGGGKSVCYQVPALVLPGVTLVVSPLIALMLDQVTALEARSIPAGLVNSTLSPDEIRDRLDAAVHGRYKLLYVAPERFESSTFRRALADMDVAMVAVDEAHCVCEWGHDFRPSYLKLREAWRLMGRPPVLALTATATPEVRRDIVKELDLRNARVIVRGFDRPNLRWTVQREEKVSEKARNLIGLIGDEAPAIVYASTRKMVQSVTETLRCAGVRALAYHAGLPQDVRPRVQEAWTTGEMPVVVATNAFGMGVDKADVRRVIHFQMPGSLEAYYQEAGRAGRDGLPADCVLLHSYRDRFTHEFFIRAAHPPRKVVLATYRALRAAAPPDGSPIPATRFLHRVPGIKSAREVYSALRLLRDAGVVENASGAALCSVRWIASRAEIDSWIEREDNTFLEPFLRCLLRAAGARSCFRASLREMARGSGGDMTTVRAALEQLQGVGVLGWREESGRSGYALTRPDLAPEALPVDWDRARARRDLELRKLKRMERYAYQRACRRRYILRYFGEDAGWRCGSCDRCAPGIGTDFAPPKG